MTLTTKSRLRHEPFHKQAVLGRAKMSHISSGKNCLPAGLISKQNLWCQ